MNIAVEVGPKWIYHKWRHSDFLELCSMNGAESNCCGANLNDGNGSNSGHARVFDWNGTAWTQVGADIDGEAADDRFGYAVSIDDAGDRIVIGAI
ncbi:MAG: hypothetical protein CM15mP65_22370 [Crocinitomicaceae bacterium]|nr:MAG: hypothetical protein CM15mP65_22370 [Crocinitomicaceae bacterium]